MEFEESKKELESIQSSLDSLANSLSGPRVSVETLYENGILSSDENTDLMIRLRNLDNGIKNLKKSCENQYTFSFNEPLNEKDIEPLTQELHDLVGARIDLTDRLFKLSQSFGKSN